MTAAAEHDGATVAAYDIARLAGVGRAAVSNWRRRYPDFPKPVGGTSASPLYALGQVQDWLTRHGRPYQLSAGDRVWQRVRGAADDLELGDLIGYLGVVLVFSRRQPRRWRQLARRDDDVLAEELTPAALAAAPELSNGLARQVDVDTVRIAREAVDAAAETGHRQLFALLRDRYLEIHSRRRVVATGDIADLMVSLAGADHGTVLDPACGVGWLLAAAQKAGAETVLGQDVDPVAAQLAAVRLLLDDAPARVQVGDALRADAFAGDTVDAVVCSPPFGDRSWGYDELASDPRWEYGLPPRGEPELAWLQHCLSHVHPGGRVAIVMPAGAATRRAGRRIRANLLRAGAMRAVVTLPVTGAGGAAPPDLWLLRRPAAGDPTPSHVLIADATDQSAVVHACREFLADAGRTPPAGFTAVPIIDLLDDEVDLSPARHLAGPAPADDGAGYLPTGAALAEALDRLAGSIPDLAEQAHPEPPPEVSLGELVRSGVVTIHQAPLKMGTDTGTTRVLTARDLHRRRAPSGHTTQEPGVVWLAPGDVVTPIAAREPDAMVIADGGAALGPQLHLLRPDPSRIDSHFLAGFVRIGEGRAASRTGSLATRSDIHRITLPRLPLAGQRRLGEAFRQLADLEDQAREVARLADTLTRRGLAGLATGRLQPPADGD